MPITVPTRSTSRTLVGVAGLCVLALAATTAPVTTATASQDDRRPVDLLSPAPASRANAEAAGDERSRAVDVDAAALDAVRTGDRISLELFDDTTVTAAVDQRTDVYSLGLVLHMMVSGQPPYMELQSTDLLFKHERGIPPTTDERFPGPPELARVIERAIALEPAARFACMEDMDLALAACQPGIDAWAAAPPEGTLRPPLSETTWPPPFPADQLTLNET